jgi:hypothetical protein
MLHRSEERRTGVLHQMPAVGDLDRVWPAISSGLDIAGTTITGDHLDRWPCSKPSGNGWRFAIRQKLDDATSLQITDDRAIAMATLEGPVIDADDAGGYHWWRHLTPNHP